MVCASNHLDLARIRPFGDVALREGRDEQSDEILSPWTACKQTADASQQVHVRGDRHQRQGQLFREG